jgi:hypothetical protein
MSEPDQPDQITRELDEIFGDYFGPPTKTDLRGVDPATFALGLCYGFDSWQEARVAANNRRNVAMAKRHWDQHHPSIEFLSRAVGTDESALRHRELLDRAHPGCAECEARLRWLSAPDPDRADPDAPVDDFDIAAWLLLQPTEDTARRSGVPAAEAVHVLHIRGRADDQSITAEPRAGNEWRLAIRDPRARQATVWIRWADGQVTQHVAAFENDLAEVYAESPAEGTRPQRVRVRVTDPPERP